MPRFKQPIPLQKLAFEIVVGCTVRYCNALRVKGSLIKLRESIAVIKQYLSNHIGILFVEFCREFLTQFYSIGRIRPAESPDSLDSAALEIMMDMEFVGLICDGYILHYLNPGDVHRIRGIKVLDWSKLIYGPVPKTLKNYRLEDLTTFIFPGSCTDLHLQIIGLRCLKLEILRIGGSTNVTDRGLYALRPCSELRIIELHWSSVSNNGVNQLLNVHQKLEEFSVDGYYRPEEDWLYSLSHPTSLVCLSVKCFSLKLNLVTSAHLHSVVELFPNLTHLRFYCGFTGDLCILKDLKYLTELDFDQSSGGFSMENLKDLLKDIGENVTHLTLCSHLWLTQDDLNFLFKVCGNIEWLNVRYQPTQTIDKLIVPPFRNLKHFECMALQWDDGYRVELEFSEMRKLEVFIPIYFHAIFEMIESIMFNNARFPNLREVRTYYYSPNEISDRIHQTAKNNNLDFSLIF